MCLGREFAVEALQGLDVERRERGQHALGVRFLPLAFLDVAADRVEEQALDDGPGFEQVEQGPVGVALAEQVEREPDHVDLLGSVEELVGRDLVRERGATGEDGGHVGHALRARHCWLR